MAQCKTCHANITWSKTEAGKTVPLVKQRILGIALIVASIICYCVWLANATLR